MGTLRECLNQRSGFISFSIYRYRTVPYDSFRRRGEPSSHRGYAEPAEPPVANTRLAGPAKSDIAGHARRLWGTGEKHFAGCVVRALPRGSQPRPPGTRSANAAMSATARSVGTRFARRSLSAHPVLRRRGHHGRGEPPRPRATSRGCRRPHPAHTGVRLQRRLADLRGTPSHQGRCVQPLRGRRRRRHRRQRGSAHWADPDDARRVVDGGRRGRRRRLRRQLWRLPRRSPRRQRGYVQPRRWRRRHGDFK